MKEEFLIWENQEFILIITFRYNQGVGGVVSLKHRNVNCPRTKDSGGLRYSAVKAVEMTRSRAGHGHLISMLDVRGRLFSI